MRIEKPNSTGRVCIACLAFLLIASSMINFSCRKVLIYPGEYKVAAREIDSLLADSVLVFGKVVSVIDTFPLFHSRIWASELSKDVYSNYDGIYNLKLPAGTYTINCEQDPGSEFRLTIKDISFLPNEKVEINFYIGARVE